MRLNVAFSRLSPSALTALIAGLMLALGATAGSLTPPGAVGSTMHSLANIYDSIASAGFDSSNTTNYPVAQNGSLIGMLKYVENQLAWASGSNNIWSITTGNVGIGTTSPRTKLDVSGNASISQDFEVGSHFINIASTSAMEIVGSVAAGSVPEKVQVVGRYAYVSNASGAGSLQIIDISVPTSPTVVGTVANGGSITNSMAVDGKFVYTANDAGTFRVIDVSNPSTPSVRGTTTVCTSAYGMYAVGRYAYVTCSSSAGFRVVDVSNPGAPVQVATNATLGSSRASFVQGRYLYAVDDSSNLLRIFDISNPLNPVSVGSSGTGISDPRDLYVAGRYAYVVNNGSGELRIFDVKNPSSPTNVGTASLGSTPLGIYVAGRYAYVANLGSADLQVIDILDPSAPVSAGTVSVTSPFDVFVAGRYAYIAGLGGTFYVIDIGGAEVVSLSGATIEAGSLNVRGNSTLFGDSMIIGGLSVGQAGLYTAGSIVASRSSYFGSHVSVSGNFELTGFVASNLTPTVTNTYSLGTSSLRWSNLFAANASISNNLEVSSIASVSQLYVGGSLYASPNLASLSATVEIAGDGTADMLKLTESDSLKSYGMVVRDGDLFLRAPSSSAAFSSRWNLLAVASNSLGLTLGIPASPSIVGTYYPGPSLAWKVDVSGKYAYVAAQASGLLIVDVSIPSSPSFVGSYNTSGNANNVQVVGKYAYVVDSSDGLIIIDVSNPSAPVRVGNIAISFSPQDVYVSGRYAYVTSGANGVRIIDISNPTSPVLVKSFVHASGTTDGVYVSGRYAYVADGSTFAALRVWDLTNINAPVEVGAASASYAFDVYVSGRYAYVADYTSGFRIFDVSRPTTPILISTTDTPGQAYDIRVHDKYAYVSDRSGGLRIYDISNPAAPTLAGRVAVSDATGAAIAGSYAYIADFTSGGLRVVDIGGVRAFALSAGSLQASSIGVTENMDIGNNLYIRGGINVGPGGLQAQGFTAFSSASWFGSHVSVSGNFELTGRASISNALWISPSGYVGNVGIGDSSPAYKLEIGTGGDINLASANAGYRIEGLKILANKGTTIAVGNQAFNTTSTGADNAAVGYQALTANTTGSFNAALGLAAMNNNTTGSWNAATGYFALRYNTGGNSNAAYGQYAALSNTNGNYNTALGADALLFNQTGSDNLAVGASAGYNALGSGNVFLGRNAGVQETGSNSLWIENSDVASSSALIYGDFSTDFLRFGATVSISGNVYMNGLSGVDGSEDYMCLDQTTKQVYFGATCTVSSLRFKQNIEDLTHGLDWVSRLRPVTFDWKESGKPSLGLIAEEVASVSPLLALYQDGQVLSVNYQIMTAVLAKAIQEQQVMIDALKAGMSADPIPLLAQDDSTLLDRIVNLFKNLLGIEFGQGSVKTDKVESRELCVGGRCVTEEEFIKVFGTPTPAPMPPAEPINSPDGTASDSATTIETPPDALVVTSSASKPVSEPTVSVVPESTPIEQTPVEVPPDAVQ